jgi:hypothetical protein
MSTIMIKLGHPEDDDADEEEEEEEDEEEMATPER